MDKKNPSLSESFAAKLLLHITVRQSREVNNLEPRCNINSVAQLALTYSLFRNRRLIFIGAMQSTSIVKQFNIFKDRLFDFSSGFEFSPIQPFTFQLWTFLIFLSNWRVLSFETMIIRQVLHKK